MQGTSHYHRSTALEGVAEGAAEGAEGVVVPVVKSRHRSSADSSPA